LFCCDCCGGYKDDDDDEKYDKKKSQYGVEESDNEDRDPIPVWSNQESKYAEKRSTNPPWKQSGVNWKREEMDEDDDEDEIVEPKIKKLTKKEIALSQSQKKVIILFIYLLSWLKFF
jgi:hypothetical protein